ncbi:hypothetical protein Dimus_024281 [Dionaea muscipula]
MALIKNSHAPWAAQLSSAPLLPRGMASSLGTPWFLSASLGRPLHCSASSEPPPPPGPPPPSQPPGQLETRSRGVSASPKPRKPAVESTDWVASSLTRRFGLGAGLAWVGFLAVGVVSEQIKTRLEVSRQQANTRELDQEEEVVLPNGIRYYEIRVGGGESPRPGDLVVINLKGQIKESGQVFVDTFAGDKKPLALFMGSRPYTKGMSEGIDYVLRTMKTGGKRRVIVPPIFGFGVEGADFDSGIKIPPSATLEYIVEVENVSIAPS